MAEPWVSTREHPVPSDEARELRRLRAAMLPGRGQDDASLRLDVLCARLKLRGYTLQAIGDALGGDGPDGVFREPVSRQGVSQKVRRAPKDAVGDVAREVPRGNPAPPVAAAVPRRPPEIPAEKLTVLKTLYPTAKLRHRSQADENPAKRAGLRVDALLWELNRDDGISYERLARELDVTPAVVRLRIRRAQREQAVAS